MIEIKATIEVTLPDGTTLTESHSVRKGNHVLTRRGLFYFYADSAMRKMALRMIERFKEYRSKR